VSISQREYLEKSARKTADAASAVMNAPPRITALPKANTESVRRNMEGTSTSMSGTWLKTYGMPKRSQPAVEPTSSSHRSLPISEVRTTVSENREVVNTWR
jgi:hypothetical protein